MAEEVEGVKTWLPGAEEWFGSVKSNAARLLPGEGWVLSTVSLFFCVIFLTGAFISWFDIYQTKSAPLLRIIFPSKADKIPERFEYSLNCSINTSMAQTCTTSNYPVMFNTKKSSSTITCPEHFRWIHEDLRPWKSTGITRDMLERAKGFGHFRVVIVKGKVYVEKYRKCFQTRDDFTTWGILQLLRLYPGKVPDLEMMFSCSDRPSIVKKQYQGVNATSVPPLVGYCGREDTLDIVFPDWTFWGWAETNIRPWNNLLEDIKRGNKKTKWQDRVPYAYWKGNPDVTSERGELMKCNVSPDHDWGARLYRQNWGRAARQGYKNSKLKDQCTHRYKIYIEGRGWSVSEKYILACDSMVLFIRPHYYDFFTRSMVPLQHYWHIRDDDMCRYIKFAVEWGNNYTETAEVIGKAGSQFIQENLKMEYVYDYMLHFLNEYAKLLKFQPMVPEGAVELCSETMACPRKGLWKGYMVESMVKSSSDTLPCNLPPPYDPIDLHAFLERKKNMTRQVERWTNEYWTHRNR